MPLSFADDDFRARLHELLLCRRVSAIESPEVSPPPVTSQLAPLISSMEMARVLSPIAPPASAPTSADHLTPTLLDLLCLIPIDPVLQHSKLSKLVKQHAPKLGSIIRRMHKVVTAIAVAPVATVSIEQFRVIAQPDMSSLAVSRPASWWTDKHDQHFAIGVYVHGFIVAEIFDNSFLCFKALVGKTVELVTPNDRSAALSFAPNFAFSVICCVSDSFSASSG